MNNNTDAIFSSCISLLNIKGERSNEIMAIYRPFEVRNVPVSCLI
jgi:hypothetical protein